MSSTLKVDILQDSGGNNLVTSNGSGVITAAGFGKIGQVVSETSSSSTTVSSNTYTDLSGMTLSITPSSTSSKILVFVQAYFYIACTLGQQENYAGIKLLRGSTDVHTPPGNATGPFGVGINFNATNGQASQFLYNFHYLDSPSTSSATTYKIQGRPFDSTRGAFIFNRDLNDGTTPTSVITAMEVLP